MNRCSDVQGRLQSTPSCLPRGSQAQRRQEKAQKAENPVTGEGFFRVRQGDFFRAVLEMRETGLAPTVWPPISLDIRGEMVEDK